jgi:hypothetical protein
VVAADAYPVLGRGQQETAEHGPAKAEEHLVGMPLVRGQKRRRWRDDAGEDQRPEDGQAHAGEAGEGEEGAETLVPIMIGGMGVDISTAELALEAARLGGIGHISDAMVNTVADRRFNAKFVKDKLKQYKFNVANSDKSVVRSISAAGRGDPRCTSAATMERSAATA